MANYGKMVGTYERVRMYATNDQLTARLRQVRDLKGITAKTLGEMTGIHRVRIAKIETGLTELRYAEAAAICQALDVDLRTLITDQPITVAVEVHVI